MKIILLNGPPSSGKDHAAKVIRNRFFKIVNHPFFRWEKMSFPHKMAFARMTGTDIDSDGNNITYETKKTEVIPWLGVSYRQWQIDFSERFMKPLYGEDIFARMFLMRNLTWLDDPNWLCVVSDCGFETEACTIHAAMPHNDVLLIRLFRDGYDFTGDSRNYISKRLKVRDTEVINNGTRDFDQTIIEIVESFIGEQRQVP